MKIALIFLGIILEMSQLNHCARIEEIFPFETEVEGGINFVTLAREVRRRAGISVELDRRRRKVAERNSDLKDEVEAVKTNISQENTNGKRNLRRVSASIEIDRSRRYIRYNEKRTPDLKVPALAKEKELERKRRRTISKDRYTRK